VIILALQFHQESLDILKIMCLLYVIYICEVGAITSSIFFSLVSTKCNIKATLHLPYLITANLLFFHWPYCSVPHSGPRFWPRWRQRAKDRGSCCI